MLGLPYWGSVMRGSAVASTQQGSCVEVKPADFRELYARRQLPTCVLKKQTRLQGVADALRAEERELGRNYKWRNAFSRVQEQLLAVEADSKALETSFPQVYL